MATTPSSAAAVEGVAEAAAVALAVAEAECQAEAGDRKGEAPDRRAAAVSPRRRMRGVEQDPAAVQAPRGPAAPDRKGI